MKRIICALQLIILFCTGIFGTVVHGYEAGELAWNEIWDPNMVDCIGSDGGKYTSDQDYWVVFYGADGQRTYTHVSGGIVQKKLRIACYDGTIQSVYCIGTGLPYHYGEEKYTKEDIQIPNDYYERLPEDAKQGIWLTLQFGYEDGKIPPVSGANEDDYWIATQVLVWEYQQGIRRGALPREDNGKVRQDVYYNMLKNRPAELCYNWIVEQVQAYLALPSFVQRSVTAKSGSETLVQYEKNGKYILELYDEAHTGTHFTLADEQGRAIPWLQVSYMDGYRYRFEGTAPIKGTVTVAIHKTIPQGGKKTLFFSDGSGTTQVVACKSTVPYASQPVGFMTLQTEDYVEIGDLQIQKQVQVGSRQGYGFEVRGENGFLQQVETNEDGIALLTGISAGWYTVWELLPENTPWQTPPVQRVEVKDRLTSHVVFQNRLKTGALSIVKTFEGCVEPRAGIAFEIVGVYDGETVYREIAETDAAGSILLSEVPIGTYTVTEQDGPHTRWYARSEPICISVEPGETAHIVLENLALRGEIQILKTGLGIVSVEEICGLKKPTLDKVDIAGCAFDVYAYEDICADDGSVRIPKGTWVERISEQNGQYRSGLLYPGTYRLEECVVAPGYEIPEEVPLILATVVPEEVCTVQVENVQRVYKTTFTKILEAGYPSQLEQVWFGLYAQDTYVAPDHTTVSPGDLLCVACPDANGCVQLCTRFPVALYVQEIVTAEGYVPDARIYPVENGTVNGGNPIVNCRIPINPVTGEEKRTSADLWIALSGICAFCFVAFYAKSRYNKEV